MADLLGRYAPESGDLERIAETAAGWAVSPEAKVAVKVWAVEVLKRCRERVGWVAESWDDIVEAVALDEGRTEDIAYFEPFYLKDFVVTTSRKKLF